MLVLLVLGISSEQMQVRGWAEGQSGHGLTPACGAHTEQEGRTWLWREDGWLRSPREVGSMVPKSSASLGPLILFSLCLQQCPCVLAATCTRNWAWPLYVGGSPGTIDIFVNGIAAFISKANF